MDVIPQKIKARNKIKKFLVFFCAFTIIACQQNTSTSSYSIDYENTSAISIRFQTKNSEQPYKVVLKGKQTPILGDFNLVSQHMVFTPIVPFTKGISYQILNANNDVLIDFTIEDTTPLESPQLVGIYPTLDTVPENLLKMYFVFSKPMQQLGNVSKYIRVFNKTENKEDDIFLFLESELWNVDHTELTLWLDPGRIKKDLIPNKQRGIPIKEGQVYVITVHKSFTDKNGQALQKDATKEFRVVSRDEQKPSVQNWQISVPSPETKEALGISFDEALDVMLIEDMIQVYSADKTPVKGTFLTAKKGNNTLFVPNQLWKKGRYTLSIDSKLEDLAGNNLHRLFDTDLSKGEKTDTSAFKTLSFIVQ